MLSFRLLFVQTVSSFLSPSLLGAFSFVRKCLYKFIARQCANSKTCRHFPRIEYAACRELIRRYLFSVVVVACIDHVSPFSDAIFTGDEYRETLFGKPPRDSVHTLTFERHKP